MTRCALFLLALPLVHAQFTIQPGHSGNESFHLKGGMLDAEGQTVEQLLQFAYHVQAGTTQGPAWMSATTYDVHGGAGSGEQVRPLLQQALADHFKLVVRKETRPTDVYVLQASPEAEAKLAGSGTPGGDHMSHIRGKGLSPESIARYLASWLGKPVVDESGLHGRYTVDITWDANNPDNLMGAVERAGLHLQKDHRPVEILVVSER